MRDANVGKPVFSLRQREEALEHYYFALRLKRAERASPHVVRSLASELVEESTNKYLLTSISGERFSLDQVFLCAGDMLTAIADNQFLGK